MTRPAIRIGLVVLLLVGLGAAGWQLYVLETRRLTAEQREETLDTLRDGVLRALDEARSAQQAYLAEGQGIDFWEARFAEAMADLSQALTALRAQAEGNVAAVTALDEADRALKVYEGIDRRIRSFVANGSGLMAADAIYEDGLKTSGVARGKIDEAHAALVGPVRIGFDQRRLQYLLTAAAAGAGLLVALALLPTGRRDDPVPEAASSTDAAEGLLHLGEPARAERERGPDTAAPAETLSLRTVDRIDSPPVAAPIAPIPVDASSRGLAEEALDSAAQVCTDLARVKDADQLRAALGKAARLLDASGVIVWVTDGAGKSLKPLLTYGYPEEALRRIPTLPRDQDNATAAAWREAVTQFVDATPTAPGAIAVPLLVPQGCVGVLAAEIRHGRETATATRALAQIVAAQLAVLIPVESA